MKSPLSFKRRVHGWMEWVRQISEAKRRKGKERMCGGVEDKRSGMGIADSLGKWLMVFVIHLGVFSHDIAKPQI